MTTAALTPQERQALNAWIAEHVYGCTWEPARRNTEEWLTWPHSRNIVAVRRKDSHEILRTERIDFADAWAYAGPLFDRYEFVLDCYKDLYGDDKKTYQVFANQRYSDHELLAEGTTGPEAIAKACKAWEESKR